MTSPGTEAVERIERYIAEYEDAPNWGGPTMYPASPKIADLKAVLTLAKHPPTYEADTVERVARALFDELEALGMDVRRLPEDDRIVIYHTPCFSLNALARAALSAMPVASYDEETD